MWLKWKAISLLLPLLCCLCHCRLEDITFSQTFELEEIPNDMELLYHGTKPSLVSCGIQCLSFPDAYTIIVCRESNQAMDCYCTAEIHFSHTSEDAPCMVFTKLLCKNGGYFDGRICNCEEGFIGSSCEIDVGSNTCVEEYIRTVDPMNTAAVETVLNGQGTLKQQVHIDDHDIIYNIVITSLSGTGGISESAEHLDIDVLDQSNSISYRLHQMFYLNNKMNTLRLGFKNQDWSESTEDVNNIQLKGFIGERINSTNFLCLEVVDGQIVHGSVTECYQGGLRGFAPTLTENKNIHRTVDSVGFKNGDLYFKFLPTMTMNLEKIFAANPAIIGNHQINTGGAASRIFWNIRNHSLFKSDNYQLQNYSVYLDTNWHLAYSNDQFGKPTHGFLTYLLDSVLGGKRVRVAFQDRMYSVQMTVVSGHDISVDLADLYDGTAWSQQRPIHIRHQVSTTGDHHYCSFESESDVKFLGASGSQPVTWFVENRCWREVIKFGSGKNIVSGTVQELYEVASTGKSLRFVWAHSSTIFIICDVIQVHLFNTSFVVMNSVSGYVHSDILTCSQMSISLYSTGTVEYTKWSPGRTLEYPTRNKMTNYDYVQVLSEM